MGDTVNYGPNFPPLIYGPSAKRAGSVIYNTDRENEVSKIFIISLYPGFERARMEAVSG